MSNYIRASNLLLRKDSYMSNYISDAVRNLAVLCETCNGGLSSRTGNQVEGRRVVVI